MWNPLQQLPGKDVEAFCRDLVAAVVKDYPPARYRPGKTGVDKALNKTMRRLNKRLAAFQREHTLRWLDRARLGNCFRWELEEAGYPEDFVTEVSAMVVSSVASPPREGPR